MTHCGRRDRPTCDVLRYLAERGGAASYLMPFMQVLAELYGGGELHIKPHIVVALVLHKLLDQARLCAAAVRRARALHHRNSTGIQRSHQVQMLTEKPLLTCGGPQNRCTKDS